MTVYRDGKPMPTFTVQKGVPMPEARKELSGLYKVAATMAIGDCIDVPYVRRPVANNLGRKLGFTFTQRKVGDLLRIWRKK